MPNKPQLFCFSFAGGNASFFDDLDNDLPEIEVMKLEYSGHGTRHKEPLYNDFNDLADDMYNAIHCLYSNNTEYALFGYSMGTISLVEVLRRIIELKELPLPRCVFLAAHEPKTKDFFVNYDSSEVNAWVKNRTIQFGAVPQILIDNESYWRMYLPLYKADYSIIGKYSFEDLVLKTKIPATVFYSETDTRFVDMELWSKIFVGTCNYHRFEGTHFFIKEHHKRIAEIIKEKMIGDSNYDIR